MGLRERKKQATRRALRDAAVSLTLEHGPENVTVEAIAAEADVSTRTFFNYFSTKEDALLGDVPATLDEQTRQVFAEGGPTGEFVEDLISLLIMSLVSSEDLATRRDAVRQRRQLMEHEPQLVPGVLARFHHVEWQLAEAVAERAGVPADDDRPQLIAAGAMAVMRYTLRRLYAAENQEDSADDIRARIRGHFRHLGEAYGTCAN